MPCQPLHNRVRLSEHQLSLLPHSAYNCIQTRHMGRGRWGLASQLQQQLVLWVCAKCCAGCHWLLAESLPSYCPLLPPTGRPKRPRATVHPHWCHIASTVAYLGSLVYCATLGGAFDHYHSDHDQLLTMSRSSIILLGDQGKPYSATFYRTDSSNAGQTASVTESHLKAL